VSAVVDVCDEVLERIPRGIVVKIEVLGEQVLRHLEVRVVELVRDVPAEHQELATLDEDAVEVAERKQ